jgi:hypothetical protein
MKLHILGFRAKIVEINSLVIFFFSLFEISLSMGGNKLEFVHHTTFEAEASLAD